jgi:hypothetical protein
MLRPRLWVASAMLCITFAAARANDEGCLLSSEPLTLTKSYVQLDVLSSKTAVTPARTAVSTATLNRISRDKRGNPHSSSDWLRSALQTGVLHE